LPSYTEAWIREVRLFPFATEMEWKPIAMEINYSCTLISTVADVWMLVERGY